MVIRYDAQSHRVAHSPHPRRFPPSCLTHPRHGTSFDKARCSTAARIYTSGFGCVFAHFLLLRLLLQLALLLIHDSFALLSDISYAYVGKHTFFTKFAPKNPTEKTKNNTQQFGLLLMSFSLLLLLLLSVG